MNQKTYPALPVESALKSEVNLHRRQTSLWAAMSLTQSAVPISIAGSAVLLGATGGSASAQTLSSALVDLLRAPAWLETAGARVPLAAGAVVNVFQTVVTGEGGRVVLKFPEGSLVALGANSRLTVETLAYRQTNGQSIFDAAFKVAVGTFRYVTALTEKFNGNNRRVKISTATATIGIRGTRFWGQSNDQHEMICLFEGKVDIERANEPLAVLDTPNAFWIAPAGQAAQPISTATPEQLRSFGGQVAAPEGSGLAKPGGGFRIASNIWLESRAKALVMQLSDLGYAATITPCASGAASMFDVIVGQFASADDARAVAAQLSEKVQRRFELVQAVRP